MKKYILFTLLAILIMGKLAQGQIAFGPYLTYSGKTGDVGQMTVQFGVQTTDTRTYYVVYWNTHPDSTKAYSKSFTNNKIINTKDFQGNSESGKYKIWYITLKGLAPGGVYRYFVSEYFDNTLSSRFSTFRFTAAKTISASDLQYDSPLVLTKTSLLSGQASGLNREIMLLNNESNVQFKNLSFLSGNNLKVSVVDKQRLYNFRVPNDTDTTLSCFVISDTQSDGRPTYPAMWEKLQTEKQAFMLHGGDFAGWANLMKVHISNYNAADGCNNSNIFGSLPIQITEGNHDVGYNTNYSATGIVSDDNLISSSNNKYTKEMIWFDKMFQFDYPGLKTRKPTSGGTDTTDYYSHYYSFDWGPVHVSVLDFNLYEDFYCDMESEYAMKQFRWLIDDLQKTTKRWKVIVTHYSKASDANNIDSIDYKGIKAYASIPALDSIILKCGVQIVINGHQHVAGTDQYKVGLETLNKKQYLLMLIPLDADNSDLPQRYGFFNFKIIGNNLSLQLISTTGTLIGQELKYTLNKEITIRTQ